MKKEVRQLIELLKYQARARSIKSVHPPFAYQLVTYIKTHNLESSHKETIFKIKRKAAANNNVIEHTDMGANSKGREYVRVFKKVSSIAANTSIKHKHGKLIYLLVKHLEPKNILELGTSLGISTLYLALAKHESSVITIEGCTETAHTAEKYFKSAGIENTETMIGGFENVLPLAIEKHKTLDLVFFDGNHRYKPTMQSFNLCKEHAGEDSVFIFDDIHWSEGMNKAWKAIKHDKDVTLTVDFFQLGIVFFKKGLSKQNLVIRY